MGLLLRTKVLGGFLSIFPHTNPSLLLAIWWICLVDLIYVAASVCVHKNNSGKRRCWLAITASKLQIAEENFDNTLCYAKKFEIFRRYHAIYVSCFFGND